MRDITRRALLATPALLTAGTARAQAERVTYLFPAPPFLQAFIPHQLAQSRGHFAREGVQVTFQTGRGGADVARQVALGNAEIGGGLGDTSMIVRANGLPVRAVALLGGRPLFQVAVRKNAGVPNIAALRGKRIGVISFQDTGYYALMAMLAANGVRRDDAQIQAVGAAGMTQLMISGNLEAITATPEWAQTIEAAGVALEYYPIDAVFPAMAQAVLTSDKLVQERPAAVRGVVRGILRALQECIADPEAAARDYVAAVPQHAGKQAETLDLLKRYATDVWAVTPPATLGRFDPARLAAVQRFYVENGIVQTAVPIAELYTNDFVGG